MRRIKRAVITAFVISIALSYAVPSQKAEKYILSALSIGWSSVCDSDNDDKRVKIIDDDEDIVYTFKIKEWFCKLFI